MGSTCSSRRSISIGMPMMCSTRNRPSRMERAWGSGGKGELLEMDVAPRHPDLSQRVANGADHAGRAAEKDVAVADVGHELAEVGGREQVGGCLVAVGAYDVVQ